MNQQNGLSKAIASAIVDFINQNNNTNNTQSRSRSNTGDDSWKKLHGKAKSGIQVRSCSGKVIDGGDFGLLRDSNDRPIGHGKLTIDQLAEIEVGARELANMMKLAKATKPRRRTAAK